MLGVILDAASLGEDADLAPVTDLLDDWRIHPSTRPHETAARIGHAGVVLSNKVVLTAEHINAAHDLEFISVMATGTNNIDLAAASARGIRVSNAAAYATPSVVQHTLSLILALSTNLHRYLADVSAGRWHHAETFCLLHHPIREVAGRQLGIFGYGELGGNVAHAARGLGMQVAISERPGRSPRAGRMSFEALLETSDYISLHCPLNPETARIIDGAALARMKPSAFLINTARGGLVDSAALVSALRDGRIAGAAVDVLGTEPPTKDETLLTDLPNLLVTPHNAWAAIESRARLIDQMRENIEGFIEGAPPRLVTR